MPTTLSSLPFLPPHRSPSRPLLSSLLASPDWLPRLAVLSVLGEAPTTHGRAGAHHVIRSAWGSTGCVNAVDWEEGGEGRLVSAGDDTKICIWTPGTQEHHEEPSSSIPVDSPSLNYGLTDAIESGHRANIFSVRFAPHAPSRLFSCAGDHEVRVFDINASLSTGSSSPVHSGTRTWTHHDPTSCTRVLRCHSVGQHDLRTPHTCGRDGGGCGPPLLAYPGLELYSLSISKARPHLFVVAGSSRHVFLHDRRMVRSAMRKEWDVEMSEGQFTQCVRKFGVPSPDGRGELNAHVVASKLSQSKPTDLLVSYSGGAIYLFDTDADPFINPPVAVPPSDASQAVPPHTQPAHAQPKRSRSAASVAAHSKRRREASALVEGDSTDVDDDDAEMEAEASAPSVSRAEPAPSPSTLERSEGEDVDADGVGVHTDTDSDDPDWATTVTPPETRRGPLVRTYEPDVPVVHPRKSYGGHANSQTLKDVNFAMAESHVVSGSDDGNWFVWEKETEKLVGIFEGDESVVNVLQPHPRLPLLAVSGIDPTVKIFGPTNGASSNMFASAESIIKRNKAVGGRRVGSASQALLSLIASRLAAGDIQVGPGQTLQLVLGTGEDDNDVTEECCIM